MAEYEGCGGGGGERITKMSYKHYKHIIKIITIWQK